MDYSLKENLFVGEYLYDKSLEFKNYFYNTILNESTMLHPPYTVNAKMTEWDLHNKYPKINSLVNFIIDKLKIKFTSLDFPINLICTSCWGVVYNNNDYIEPHNHFPKGIYSFVYYVDGDDESSPLIFCTTGHKIYPEPGKFIIFDSKLVHEVPENKSKTRICISGDIGIAS